MSATLATQTASQVLPQTMRALVLTSPGKFEIQTVPVPRPGAQEVLCKVGAVAICGSDPEIVRGDLAGTWPPAYPFTPGHEWAGEVVATGPGVVDLAPGDRVAGQAHCGCGTCANCMEGRYSICENYGRPESGQRHYGFITTGAYAQFAVLSVKSVNLMPPSMSFRDGALVDTAGVVLHGLELSGVRPGGHRGGHRARPDRANRDAHGASAGVGASHRGRTRRSAGGGRASGCRRDGELRT